MVVEVVHFLGQFRPQITNLILQVENIFFIMIIVRGKSIPLKNN